MLIEILNYDNVNIKEEAEFVSTISQHIEVLRNIVYDKNVKTMVEVGTFLGGTAIKMAHIVDKYYTVDIYNFKPMEKFYQLENLQKQFLRNTYPLSHKITPIKGNSSEVGELFKRLGLKFDLVYIDADHHYKVVKKDLQAWFSISKFLCGDDYDESHPGVIKAVNEFAEDNYLNVINIDKNFWYYE